MIDGREVMSLAVLIDADNVSNFSTLQLLRWGLKSITS